MAWKKKSVSEWDQAQPKMGKVDNVSKSAKPVGEFVGGTKSKKSSKGSKKPFPFKKKK